MNLTTIPKNGVFSMDFPEYTELRNVISNDKSILLGEIQGEEIYVGADKPKDRTFWNCVVKALKMPDEVLQEINNANWFRDELATLNWLDHGKAYKGYILVFLAGIPNVQKEDYNYYISLLKDTIYYWQEEADEVYIDTGKRDFTVYLVD